MAIPRKETFALLHSLVNDPEQHPILNSLSERQKSIATLVAADHNYAKIAEAVGLEEYVVGRYVSGIRANILRVKTSKAWQKGCGPEAIALLHFSGRTSHGLEVNEIETIPQLIGYTESELIHMNKIGRKAVGEIKCVLAEHGLSLKAY